MMTNMPSELWWLLWQWQKQLDLLSTAMGGVEITGIPDNTVDETIWTGITNNNYLDWIYVTDRCDIYLQHLQHFAYIHTQSETKTFLREEKRFSRNLWNFLLRKMGSPLFSLIWTIQENADSTIQNFHISNFLNSSMELLRQIWLNIKLIKVFQPLQRKHARTQSMSFNWEGKYIHFQGNYIHRIETAGWANESDSLQNYRIWKRFHTFHFTGSNIWCEGWLGGGGDFLPI